LALLLFSQFVPAAVAVAIYSLIILVAIDIISAIDMIVVLMLHFVLPRIIRYAMCERARYASCTRYVGLLLCCCLCHVPMTSATNGDESASSSASGVRN